MSLFRTTIRPPAPISDEAIERYLAAIRADLEPDALFRRRLRGSLVNRYVAAREGLATRRSPVREMTRIGRAVLVASFVLGISVTGAMAASQHAIPGDVLYTLKLDVEELRYRVVPGHLHDELAAHALAERIVELDRLADTGDSHAVAAHARAVEAAYEKVVALGGDSAGVEDRLALFAAVLDRLPDRARAVVEAALGDAIGDDGQLTDPSGVDTGAGPAGGGGRGETGRPDGPPGRGSSSSHPHSSLMVDDNDEDSSTPFASPSPVESPSPEPRASEKPKPTPAGQPAQPTRPPHPHSSPSATAP
ncbi:MAG TPA: hypothetical protein VLA76_04885 [Candidatus Angelobacter sp.]|nr:hypothetical protein [Candidatus Angelobacter sp.]